MRISDWSSDVCSSDLTASRTAIGSPERPRSKAANASGATRAAVRSSVKVVATATSSSSPKSGRSCSRRTARSSGASTCVQSLDHVVHQPADLSPAERDPPWVSALPACEELVVLETSLSSLEELLTGGDGAPEGVVVGNRVDVSALDAVEPHVEEPPGDLVDACVASPHDCPEPSRIPSVEERRGCPDLCSPLVELVPGRVEVDVDAGVAALDVPLRHHQLVQQSGPGDGQGEAFGLVEDGADRGRRSAACRLEPRRPVAADGRALEGGVTTPGGPGGGQQSFAQPNP